MKPRLASLVEAVPWFPPVSPRALPWRHQGIGASFQASPPDGADSPRTTRVFLVSVDRFARSLPLSLYVVVVASSSLAFASFVRQVAARGGASLHTQRARGCANARARLCRRRRNGLCLPACGPALSTHRRSHARRSRSSTRASRRRRQRPALASPIGARFAAAASAASGERGPVPSSVLYVSGVRASSTLWCSRPVSGHPVLCSEASAVVVCGSVCPSVMRCPLPR